MDSDKRSCDVDMTCTSYDAEEPGSQKPLRPEIAKGGKDEGDYSDPQQQLASQHVRRQFTTGSKDTLPEIADINERNRSAAASGFWGTPKSSETVASNENFKPTPTGSINVEKRTSTTASSLNLGLHQARRQAIASR